MQFAAVDEIHLRPASVYNLASRLESHSAVTDETTMEESGSTANENSIHYDPLPTSIDCIRLLHLGIDKASSNISGNLITVTFAERPKYDALSYEWGTDSPSETIAIDGHMVTIRKNLHRALTTILSSQKAGTTSRVFWIDALCINQRDFDERSRQVRLMPFIYTRAQRVLLWLGNLAALDGGPAISGMRNEKFKGGLASAVLPLCLDSYWRRMWIIQEIILAREVEIHFESIEVLYKCLGHHRGIDNRHLSNGTSINWVQFSELAQEFPELRATQLIEQKRERFGDSHLLLNLLRNHRAALCQDPRDKIYGLIGIAIDVDADFPMRYGTPLTEVYAALLDYQNKKYAQSQKYGSHRGMLEFCQLVGEALQLDVENGQERVRSIPMLPLGLSGSGPPLLRITLGLAGYVQSIGPSLDDMISVQSATIEWRTTIREEFKVDSIGRKEALEQNDSFLEVLENFDHAHQNIVFSFEDRPRWWGNRFWNRRVTVPKSNIQLTELPDHSDTPICPRTFLLKPNGWHGEKSKDRVSNGMSPGFIGLAPSDSQPGDLVYYISGSQRVLIIRDLGVVAGEPSSDGGEPVRDYAFIGCAGLAQNHYGALSAKKKRKERQQEEARAIDAFSIPPEHWLSLWDFEMPLELAQRLSASCYA